MAELTVRSALDAIEDAIYRNEKGDALAILQNARDALADEQNAVLEAYTWAIIEAKNLLRCISLATDHAAAVDQDLQPAIGSAIDGVARLLDCVSRQLEHLDMPLKEAAEVSHG